MFAKAVSLVALAVALGGGALAVGAIPAPDGTVNACFSTRTGSLRVVDSRKRKCRKGERAIAWSQRGPVGTRGAQGAPGANGTNGTNGTDGTDGSPDTAAQVRDKLTTVDGPDSGLDADLVDGRAPASSSTTLGAFTENGGTVSFAPIVNLPGLGTIESDCNSETDTDTHFHATVNGVHVMVDTGGANANQASVVSAGNETADISANSYSSTQPEFQIWRIQTGVGPGATVFLEIRPQSSNVCEWRSQVVATTS